MLHFEIRDEILLSSHIIDDILEFHSEGSTNTEIAQQVQRKNFDKGQTRQEYKVGDLVLIEKQSISSFGFYKLVSLYQRPF